MTDVQQGDGGGDMTRQTFEAQVIERSLRDPEFRQELMSNPRDVMEREFGMRIPEGVEIKVIEETPEKVYLVLPQGVASGGEAFELSDEELDAVAGGLGPRSTNAWTWCCIVSLY